MKGVLKQEQTFALGGGFFLKIVTCDALEKGKVVKVGDLLIVGIKKGKDEVYNLNECYIDFSKATREG